MCKFKNMTCNPSWYFFIQVNPSADISLNLGTRLVTTILLYLLPATILPLIYYRWVIVLLIKNRNMKHYIRPLWMILIISKFHKFLFCRITKAIKNDGNRVIYQSRRGKVLYNDNGRTLVKLWGRCIIYIPGLILFIFISY